MNIVITDAKTVTNGDVSFEKLKLLGNLTVHELTCADLLDEYIKDADAVICNKTVFSEKNLEKAKNLKYIGLFATGYNNIDTLAARKHNITVCNAGSYSTNAVAQHTFAFILNHCSPVAKYDEFVSKGNWIKSDTFSPFVFNMCELYGKTLGIIGYGSIGKAVAQIALAFGMRVLVTTRSRQTDDRVSFVSFDDMLAGSDFVTVHCPLTDATKGMFNKKAFATMKDGAYFVNTSRGGVVDDAALVEAVRTSKLSGAAIDVLTYEPMREDCLLYNVPGITITPHVAWAPLETRERLMEIVCDNLKSFIEGHPKNVVN